jgi:hypothetical protein
VKKSGAIFLCKAAGGMALGYGVNRAACYTASQCGFTDQQIALLHAASDIINIAIFKYRLSENRGLGANPFKGKTPQQIHEMLMSRGFKKEGRDPINGKGAYFHPETGRKYYIDPGGKYKKGTELPHVDVHRMINGECIEDIKRKYPLGDKLYE